MPDQPTWLERVPEILAQLGSPDSPPFLDRPAVERLFGLRRRQAIELMRRLPGYQVGKTFLVDRHAVLAFLTRPALRNAAEGAIVRKRRVLEHLAIARRDWHARQIHIPPPADAPPPGGLPDGVDLQPGRLTVDFAGPVDLMSKLFALSQALAADFEEIARRVSVP